MPIDENIYNNLNYNIDSKQYWNTNQQCSMISSKKP